MLSEKELEAFYQKVGLNIKSARIAKQISQEDLAKYLGFKSRISVANIENAKQSIQLHTIFEVAAFLNVPILDLLPPNNSLAEINKTFVRNIQKTLNNDTSSSEKMMDFVRFVTAKK